MKNKIRAIFLPFIIVGLFILYLFVNPVFYEIKTVLAPRRLPNLEAARNYYSVLSAFGGFLIGIMGLVVGYQYYKHKQLFDESVAERERKRKKLDDLISKLEYYDDLVHDLIHFRFHSSEELGILRQKIHRNFETIEAMINLSELLLGLDESDIAALVKVYSFIEKNDVIMQKSFEESKPQEYLEYLDVYVSLLKEAKRKCLARVA